MAGRHHPHRGIAGWPTAPFFWSSIGLAAVAGFGLGATLFLGPHLGLGGGAWWAAAAQAHGHVQLFGWAGMMVLGVSLHFLPRLRGYPLVAPALVPWAWGLLVGGLLLRAVAQPLTAAGHAGTARFAAGAVVTSGLAEWAGGSLAVGCLAATAIKGPALRERVAVPPVLPFFATAFASLWMCLALNGHALAAAWPPAATGSAFLAQGAAQRLVVRLALLGFLVPMSVAMSVRTFPLFYSTQMPALRPLHAALGALVAGLAAHAAAEVAGGAAAVAARAAGSLLEGGALLAFVVGLHIFRRRRPLPRREVQPLREPLQLLVISAYVWLALAGSLLVLQAAGEFTPVAFLPPTTAVWHALGAGFVTSLILGVGPHLLPGALGRRVGAHRPAWWLFALGAATAVLRIVPVLAAGVLPAALTEGLLGAAGAVGVAALVPLTWMVTRPRA